MNWRAMTRWEKAREVARIRNVFGWPQFPILHVKKLGANGYEAFGTISANDQALVVKHKFDEKVEQFDSVEVMVEAGWIGD
jgi:hypothetical protein